MNIYQVDAVGCWTGEISEINEYQGAPVGWVLSPPPELGEGEYALWSGRWSVTTVVPTLDWPAPPAPTVPQSISMRQCRIALLDAGLLDAVKSSIATMPGVEGERARIDWEYAQEVRRDWPLIGYMAGDLGLTDEQVDGLFMAAAAI